MLPCTFYFRRTHATIIVSQSFDGELIARTLELFGYKTARGSSSRGGAKACSASSTSSKIGGPAIFTADGPRGPIYRTKTGPIRLAHSPARASAPFILSPERAWTMRSWDRFLVPRPFTRIAVSWARWTRVPADLAEDQFEAETRRTQRRHRTRAPEALAHFGKRDV